MLLIDTLSFHSFSRSSDFIMSRPLWYPSHWILVAPPDGKDFVPRVSCQRSDVTIEYDADLSSMKVAAPIDLSLSHQQESCYLCLEPTYYRFLCFHGHPFCQNCLFSTRQKLNDLVKDAVGVVQAYTWFMQVEAYDNALKRCGICREYAQCIPQNKTSPDDFKSSIDHFLLKYGLQ